MKNGFTVVVCMFLLIACNPKTNQSGVVVIQTDFGVKDGAVAAMKGVAYGVDDDLMLVDLTHEIPAYNIWEAAYCCKNKKRTLFLMSFFYLALKKPLIQ